jgi:hypothetical protein
VLTQGRINQELQGYHLLHRDHPPTAKKMKATGIITSAAGLPARYLKTVPTARPRWATKGSIWWSRRPIQRDRETCTGIAVVRPASPPHTNTHTRTHTCTRTHTHIHTPSHVSCRLQGRPLGRSTYNPPRSPPCPCNHTMHAPFAHPGPRYHAGRAPRRALAPPRGSGLLLVSLTPVCTDEHSLPRRRPHH